MINSMLEASSRTVSKILRRMKISCFRCGWNEALCDIHHIKPQAKGGTHDHSNLCILCPNCHRVVHENKIEEGLKSVQDVLGDSWKDFYYEKGSKHPEVQIMIREGMKRKKIALG